MCRKVSWLLQPNAPEAVEEKEAGTKTDRLLKLQYVLNMLLNFTLSPASGALSVWEGFNTAVPSNPNQPTEVTVETARVALCFTVHQSPWGCCYEAVSTAAAGHCREETIHCVSTRGRDGDKGRQRIADSEREIIKYDLGLSERRIRAMLKSQTTSRSRHNSTTDAHSTDWRPIWWGRRRCWDMFVCVRVCERARKRVCLHNAHMLGGGGGGWY